MGRQSIMNQKKVGGIFRLVLVLRAFAVQIIALNSKSLVQINFPENSRSSKFKSGL
jgi:hypothetical protein